ncbi:hypothetical protein J537_2499 [Acinetobacter baumannii 1437282]|nr:hypothetical protein J537_2499 [Acinetobacter baumannii 1437282]
MKKKDIFGQELKLTKKEKAEHKSRMKKFEAVSLYMIQIQRLLEMLYKFFIHLGKSVFPNEETKQKLYEYAVRLIKQFIWLIAIPIVCDVMKDILITPYLNSFTL